MMLLIVILLLDYGHNLEWQVNVLGYAICHELEDTIRRYEGNGAVAVKATESNALMELYVIYLDSTILSL